MKRKNRIILSIFFMMLLITISSSVLAASKSFETKKKDEINNSNERSAQSYLNKNLGISIPFIDYYTYFKIECDGSISLSGLRVGPHWIYATIITRDPTTVTTNTKSHYCPNGALILIFGPDLYTPIDPPYFDPDVLEGWCSLIIVYCF